MGICGKWWERVFFRGLHQVNLDDKGRLAIPKRWRDLLAQSGEAQWVVTIDVQSPCLLLYPLQAWGLIEQKLMALPNMDQAARRYQRLLIGHAHDVEPDAQGRIRLPGLLREHAALAHQAMLVGQGNKIEVWSQENWTRDCPDMLAQARNDPLPEALTTLSI